MPKKKLLELKQQLNDCQASQRFKLSRRLQRLHKKPDENAINKLQDAITASCLRREHRLKHLPQPKYPQELPVSERREDILKCIQENQVTILCGETGSGKTTTLHAILGFLNTPDKKIWTAEDPVEITQYRLQQVQVNRKVGFTFEKALRAFLRADPDVVLIGEMRDKETAKAGIEASLTGHFVFSTLHTNSAPETITRLIDMGMDPINFSDACVGIVAQRLVRSLCTHCKEPYSPSEIENSFLPLVVVPI